MQIEQFRFSGSLDPQQLAPLQAIGPQAVLAFGSVAVMGAEGFDEALRQAFPDALRLGCSTAGEIAGDGVYEGSCVITALRFDGNVHLKVAAAHIGTMDQCHAAGMSIGQALAAPELRGVLLFGKGIDINGSALIEGVVAAVGAGVPITGGLAGDDGAFQSTLTLTPNGVSADGVVALGLYGEQLLLGHGSYGGWMAFGPARKVTRSAGNILYELDGEPALNVYKNYLGDYASELPASGLLFPFEMLNENHDTLGLIRTILGVDEEQGALVLAGDIVPGGFLRLMHASVDELVVGAEEAAKQARSYLPEQRSRGLALLVSCVGRRLVMGDQVDDEVDAVVEQLGEDGTVTGFYSYGEISPFSTTTDCKLHNQTMTVTFIGEA